MALTYDQQVYYRRVIQDFGIPEGAGNFKSDTFTGDGATTVFNLNHAPDVTNFTPIVLLNNAFQNGSQISIAGMTLTFITAPPNSSNIQCNYQY